MSQMQPSTQQQQSSQLTDSQGSQQGVRLQQTGASQQGVTGQQFPTKNYLSETVRTSSIAALQQCLADLTAVNMQCKTAHWNVRGPNFYQLHELFEDLIEDFEPLIDVVAERATALGGQAPGTAPLVAQRANVPQLSATTSNEQQLLEQVATSLSTLDSTIYDQINRVAEQGDLDTADLLNEVSRAVSKALWFVEAHLQSGGIGQQQAQASGTGFQAQQQFQG